MSKSKIFTHKHVRSWKFWVALVLYVPLVTIVTCIFALLEVSAKYTTLLCEYTFDLLFERIIPVVNKWVNGDDE